MKEISSISSYKRIAVVTGGNKGIGLEICRQLATKGIVVVLTARDERRGTKAVEDLKQSGIANVVFHRLEVSNQAHITSLVDFIRTNFGKLDILVNNAGIGGTAVVSVDSNTVLGKTLTDLEQNLMTADAHQAQTYELAAECTNTNYIGCQRLTEALIPLLKLSNSPRIVMVTSSFGRLRFIPSESIKKELRDLNSLTEDKLSDLCQQFLKSFQESKLEEDGWPTNISAYKVSKVLMVAYTRVLAKKYPGFCINSVHPGYVKTDINFNLGSMSVEEGARGPVMLCLLPNGGISGAYFHETEESSFE